VGANLGSLFLAGKFVVTRFDVAGEILVWITLAEMNRPLGSQRWPPRRQSGRSYAIDKIPASERLPQNKNFSAN
jgi:hypothetical protein